jgi:hypothetical protein
MFFVIDMKLSLVEVFNWGFFILWAHILCCAGTTVPGLRDGLGEEEDHSLELSRKSLLMEVEGLVKSKGKEGRMLFGVEMSPDTIAIAMVYFVQGILGLSRLAVSFFLKDDLHLDPAEVSWWQKRPLAYVSTMPGFSYVDANPSK